MCIANICLNFVKYLKKTLKYIYLIFKIKLLSKENISIMELLLLKLCLYLLSHIPKILVT